MGEQVKIYAPLLDGFLKVTVQEVMRPLNIRNPTTIAVRRHLFRWCFCGLHS